ncbi:helix-turn-helix domain-containing protein [Kribbella sp. NPDC004875]|uniref:helix-turn-helix domain-containing protein n=1 Tax=Kribbella sp. NPDC004875 TaxID=3364107 RepID=UPI00367B7092
MIETAAFGPLLRQCRQAVGLSLRQLAARVGYDYSYLSQVERGQRPGSADLARLCDRELGTGAQLTTSFERRPARTSQQQPEPANGLETAWRGLVATAGEADRRELLGDVHAVPPTVLLPELVSLLRARSNQTAELSMLIAETLTRLGDTYTARRWWWAARAAADGAGETSALVRAREAISGLAERRPAEALLQLADDAVTLDRQRPGPAGCFPRAARALVLAELGQTSEIHAALQELIGVGDELLQTGAVYELHWAEGRVCAQLGYGVAGCVLLERARELCPDTWIGERARLDLTLSECLVVAGEVAAGLALALRALIELPDEWHDLWVYDAAHRVLRVVPDGQLGGTELRALLAHSAYRSGRSVGGGSRWT